jgi:glycerol-3-phosphate acyltransferase PlsY
VDLRQVGSGNLGATNTFRVLGVKGAIGVLALDVGKGAAAPLGFAHLRVDPPPCSAETLAVCAAVAAIGGHIFPVYTRFRGGKGIATTAGAFLGLQPAACGLALVAFAAGLLGSRGIVSVGSLCGAVALPVGVILLERRSPPVSAVQIGAALGLTVLIVLKHTANIARLRRGEEKSIFRRREAPPAGRPVR